MTVGVSYSLSLKDVCIDSKQPKRQSLHHDNSTKSLKKPKEVQSSGLQTFQIKELKSL